MSANQAIICRLKAEIRRLNEQQIHALEMAVFGGMTPGEGEEYDERHNTIAELTNELAMLQTEVLS